MNKSVYLGLLILDLSKTVMNECWNNFVKPKQDKNIKFCQMDADSFLVYVKIYIYKDIAKDVEKRFETSNYELNRPFPKGESRKVIR